MKLIQLFDIKTRTLGFAFCQPPKKSIPKSLTQKKSLQNFKPKKSPQIANFKPKKGFRTSPSLIYLSTPPPPLGARVFGERTFTCTAGSSYIAFTTQPGTQRVMISGRVGQPSHHAIYLASICIQRSTAIKGKLNAPKPDTKTPPNQQVEKTGKRVPPTKAVVPPSGF